jgi:hypothetical protein
MGATDGAVGTAVAQKEVRADITTAGGIVLGQPEFYLSGYKSKSDAEGNLIDEKTLEHIDGALTAFTAFVERFTK